MRKNWRNGGPWVPTGTKDGLGGRAEVGNKGHSQSIHQNGGGAGGEHRHPDWALGIECFCSGHGVTKK